LKNLGIKIFSLAFAIGLSYYVNSETNVSVIGFGAPIEIRNIPEDKMLVWPLSTKVQVTVRGPSYLVSQVATSNLTYKLDLPLGVPDSYQAELRMDALSLPPSVEVVAIEPAQIELSFDKKIKKELPVVVPRYGSLAEDVSLINMEVKPSTVTVVGPQSALQNISGIETEPVDFRNLRSDISKKLILRSPGSLISSPLDHVEIKIQVRASDINRSLKDLPIELRLTNGTTYTVTPTTTSVEIRGPSAILNELELNGIVPYIRVDGLAKKGDKITIVVEVPNGVQLVQVVPKIVSVLSVVQNRTAGKN